MLDTVELVVHTVIADIVTSVADTVGKWVENIVEASVADMLAAVEARIPEHLCLILHCCRLGI